MPAKGDGPIQDLPSTHWSLIRQICQDDQAIARVALSELLQRYMPALRSYLVVQKRLAPDRADDVIQGFMASEVLVRGLIRRADRARGRFRALLVTALDRYIIRDLRRRNARKRIADRAVSLEAVGPAIDPGMPQQADVFDVAWARQVIDQTLSGMRRECDGAGRPDLWTIFEGRILAPTLDGAEPVSYDRLVQDFGLGSPKQAANAVITARRMFVRHLRMVVAEYVLDPDDLDSEINDLHEILSRAGAASRRHR